MNPDTHDFSAAATRELEEKRFEVYAKLGELGVIEARLLTEQLHRAAGQVERIADALERLLSLLELAKPSSSRSPCDSPASNGSQEPHDDSPASPSAAPDGAQT